MSDNKKLDSFNPLAHMPHLAHMPLTWRLIYSEGLLGNHVLFSNVCSSQGDDLSGESVFDIVDRMMKTHRLTDLQRIVKSASDKNRVLLWRLYQRWLESTKVSNKRQMI